MVVLGHIDHGKSTLLGAIRKSEMPEEAGDITQHIGAYVAKTEGGKKITFIDTPGHEAFEKVRGYGAQVADIAVLVVAADQGVEDQTKEAIKHIQKSDLPMVVAVNKVDLSNANPGKIKTELIEEGVQVEEQGGEVPSVDISAKNSENLGELLEMIDLIAGMEELKASPGGQSEGVVLSSYRDPKEGLKTTLLVRDGTLEQGHFVVVEDVIGKVRMMRDWRGQTIKEAGPSEPAEILGFSGIVSAGKKFMEVESKKQAEQLVEKADGDKNWPDFKDLTSGEANKVLHLVIKADEPSCLQAIKNELAKNLKSDQIGLHVIKADVGPVATSDVKMALASQPSMVVGFNVRQENGVKNLLQEEAVEVKLANTIYDIADSVKEKMESLLEPEVQQEELGTLEVLEVFMKRKGSMIVGGKVKEGELRPDAKVEVVRNDEVVGEGKLQELKRGKQDVKQVEAGYEAGLMFAGETNIKEGDVLRVYKEKTVHPTL